MWLGRDDLARQVLVQAPADLRDIFMVRVSEGQLSLNEHDYEAARRATKRPGG